MTTRQITIAIFAVSAACNAFAAANNPAEAQARRGTPPPAQQAQLEALTEAHRTFLDQASLLLQKSERDLFVALSNDEERDTFIRLFWERRGDGYRDQFLRRLAAAKSEYPDVTAEMPRTWIVYGPAAVAHVNCERFLQPVQIWSYRSTPLGGNAEIIFYVPRHQKEYRILQAVRDVDAIEEILSPTASADGFTARSVLDSAPRRAGRRIQNTDPRFDSCAGLDPLLAAITSPSRSTVAQKALTFAVPPLRRSDLAAAALAAAPPEPSPEAVALPEIDPAKSQGVRKLSRRERKDRTAALHERYRKFLAEVEPILLDVELNAFLALETDAQRDLYIEHFWRRRDPYGTADYRDLYLERLGEARQRFKYLSSDRSRVYLIHGRPVGVLRSDCTNYLQPLELWQYAEVHGLGRDVTMLFYQPRTGGEYRLWVPIIGFEEGLKELVSQEAVGRMGEGAAVQDVFFNTGGGRMNKIAMSCSHGEEILNAVYRTNQDRFRFGRVFEPPKVDVEDANSILRAAVIPTPGAPPLETSGITSRYPAKRGSRTATELSVVVDAAKLKIRELNGEQFYNIDLSGEVLRNGKMYENFRYRFDYPAGAAQIPVVVERYLRPATYQARLKIIDVNTGAESIVETDLTVPYLEDAPEKTAGGRVVDEIHSQIRSGTSRLRLAPLGNDLVTGLQKIETISSGDDIRTVEFYLDGRKVMSKRTPPYELELDLGNVPRLRRIRAIGLDAAGDPIAADELILNAGTDPFHVRIVSPSIASKAQGRVRVEMEASIPDGRKLRHLELYLNETKLATLYDPPFVQSIVVPASLPIAYLRAVATLDDEGLQPAEDVVFLNAPEFMQQVEVHLIELPVTVLHGGKPVKGLQQSAFRVTDGGAPATISKFEYVTDLPLSIGLAIDSSGSMRDRMDEAQKAGATFFKRILRSGDKAFVVSFDTQPALVQKWTPALADLSAGLASLRAEEATSLYDAIVFSLYQFQGTRGQRALVVITDGKDTSSKFSFDQGVEYAKRSGIPIYAIAIGIRQVEIEVRSKLSRFASETGGAVYYIDKASDLERIYRDIEEELRSQYVLGIYPPADKAGSGEWRAVSVDVSGGKAKTISGYYQ
jgi:Ca-activated chloride channel homolog